MVKERISAKFVYPAHYVDVLGSKMHYIEQGQGDPILFLHGIPTSSYLWRNIIPYLAPLGRCIAPDLIGLGKSDKPNIEYTVFDHIRYLDEFIKNLGLKNIILVMHGWGSVIGFHYAMQHEKNCRGLVFYEAFLRTLNEDEEEAALPFQEQLIALRKQDATPSHAVNSVEFVDKIITQSIMRTLTNEEMASYCEPFKQEQAGRLLHQYLKELPRGDGKSQIDQLIMEYTKKLMKSKLPKLMLYSVPGFVTTIATALWAKENLPNLSIVDIGEELHLAQESNPELMGEQISVWLQGIEAK